MNKESVKKPTLKGLLKRKSGLLVILTRITFEMKLSRTYQESVASNIALLLLRTSRAGAESELNRINTEISIIQKFES